MVRKAGGSKGRRGHEKRGVFVGGAGSGGGAGQRGGVRAQDVTASITGTVTDQTGAVIAGATVTAKDVARGTAWRATTNNEGVYSLLRVPVGTYDIRVESQGFQVAVQQGV